MPLFSEKKEHDKNVYSMPQPQISCKGYSLLFFKIMLSIFSLHLGLLWPMGTIVKLKHARTMGKKNGLHRRSLHIL